MGNNYKHIHIVCSSPRSGSTLLAELFRTCFEVDGYYDHEKSIFKCTPWNHNVMLSKSATEAIYLPWLLHINPALWCVYIIRDPRDVIISKHKNFPDRFLSNLRIWKTYHRAASRAFGHPRFIAIKYEDMIADPDTVQEKLAKALPFLSVKGKFSKYGEHTPVSADSEWSLNGVRAINSESIGKWKKFPQRIKWQIKLHGEITSELVKLGYEPDDSWEKLLEGATEDSSPGGLPDKLSWHKALRMKYRVFRKVIYYTWLIHIKHYGSNSWA